MSTRSELRTLIRLAPEIDTTTLSNTDCNTLLDKAQIDLALLGRAIPRNEKVNLVANQAEYVVSGASPVLTDNGFLALDPEEGGVLYFDGTDWRGPRLGFEPVTREWLDANYPGWRSLSADTTHLYWYLGTKEDNASDTVIGLVPKPSASATDRLWVHYLSRGTLMTDDAHYPWTGSTTELRHLTPYDMLLVHYVWEFVYRNITKNDADADKHKVLYTEGAKQMAMRMPLSEHLKKQAFNPPAYFVRSGWGGMRR